MPILRRALSGASKTLTINASERSQGLLASAGGRPTRAGISVGPTSALRAAAVSSAVTLNAQTVAMMPITFRTRGDRTRTPVYPLEVRPLWEQPNPDQTLSAFVETIVMSLQLHGGFYGAVQRNRREQPIAIWPIDPARVADVDRLEDERGSTLRFRVLGYRRNWGDDHDGEPFLYNEPDRPAEVLFIPWITLPGRIKGIDPIAHHAELIGMSLSSQQHAAGFLGDGVHMSGVLNAPSVETKADAKELWENFNLMHQGPAQAGRVGVLAGDATFTPLTIPPQTMQFLEQMQYSDRKIASIYRVPPHMVGDTEKSTSWGTGLEEGTKGFVTFTSIPIAIKIEQAVIKWLMPGGGVQMKFNANGLLRGSVKDRGDFYQALFGMGALNADGMLELEDLPPLPDGRGSTYLTQLNMADAEGRRAAVQRQQAQTLKELIDAGADPASAARVLGLDGLTFPAPSAAGGAV
jgi:HK97 family phage portal protein